ncbi:aKG-HExxH-type peptide beta-hydroxylase [Bacillus salipaludis]|uniref:aKG-HExxH-type peptide beta-hydroxylase n=1 Tax=Bacillus salipaludis TaxID=2547811 RepID=UPI001F3FC0FB|nr:HEXXH motif-containing putative peptide modification protein [Bacillus salipaludis]
MDSTLTKGTNFSFLNSTSINNNVDSLINFYFGENTSEQIKDEYQKKELYFKALNNLQESQIPYGQDIKISFDSEELCELLIKHEVITREDTVNNMHVFPQEEREEVIYKIEKGLELIKILHPNLYSLIKRHFGTIYLAKRKGFGGGTVSSLLGLLWLNPPKKWSVIDYAEALYHEFIHNTLFLDDMVNSIFPNPADCYLPEALTTSTILKKKRPIDRSFHAANVSIGIMHLYYMLGDKKKSRMYKEELSKTMSELNERKQFFGERGIEILNEMNKFIKLYDFENITESLNN